MIHVVGTTFIGTSTADICTECANLFGEPTMASTCVGTQAATCRAFHATRRARVLAFRANHVGEATAALGCAIVAGINTGLGIRLNRVPHGVAPWVEIIWAQRTFHRPSRILATDDFARRHRAARCVAEHNRYQVKNII